MEILWQIIAICLVASVQGDQKEQNYCGRLDVRPDHVKHYLTTPGYPARAAEAGRCQWLMSTNGDFNILFTDLTVQKLCSAGNGVVFVDVLAKQRIAHESICNSKAGQVFVTERNEVEVIITFPAGAALKIAYQKINPGLAKKLNAIGKGPSVVPAGGRPAYGRPKSPFRVPQIAHGGGHHSGHHGARASAIPSHSSTVNYGTYGGASYAAGNKNYKNYGNYRYNQVSNRQSVGAEYNPVGAQGNQVQSYENVDYQVYVDDDYYQE